MLTIRAAGPLLVLLPLLIGAVLVVVSSTSRTNEQNNASAVKVIILAGQSNAEGHGSLDHLETLMKLQPHDDNVYRAALWDDDNNNNNSTSNTSSAGVAYKVRDDVFLKFHDNHGSLTARRDGAFAGGKNQFGPELMLGWTLGDALSSSGTPEKQETASKILLIKTAWGGKTLAVDFRPPSSGPVANYTSQGLAPKRIEDIGLFYRKMVDDVLETLDNIATYVPGYDENSGYIVDGIVWFQGWNDYYFPEESVAEYGRHLGNLIRDVRHDLKLPDLPFIIGELGMHGGEQHKGRIAEFRKAQEGVTLEEEFQNNTLFVQTSPYAVLSGDKFNGIWHYNGRADTYFHIGQAFARGILHMMKEKEIAREST